MTSLISRLLPRTAVPSAPPPGLYHSMAADTPRPYRLHLRLEPDGTGILMVNASIVLHLNPTAAAHAYEWIRGASPEAAARAVAARYRVSRRRARQDQEWLRTQVITLATTPELDPVQFLGLERHEPRTVRPSAPLRLDLALTYRIGPGGAFDPLARRRVERELTTEEWQRILTSAWEAGIPHVTFTGGEPTLRSDLVALVQHAENLGQITGLLTDGRRLTETALLNGLSQAGLDHILVAVDMDDPASLNGLQAALATDIFTAAHLTLTTANAQQIRTRIRRLAEMGLQNLSLSAADRAPQLSSDLGAARDFAATLGLDLVWGLPAPYSAIHPLSLEVEEEPGVAMRTCLYVEPDGDVLPAQGTDRVLGNALRDRWSDLWAAT